MLASMTVPTISSMLPLQSRIAVIGTGISGMAAAHLLHPHHRITVYEQADRPGGHARTVHVRPKGATQLTAVDTGFIVYNERNYPELTGLFAHLDVPTQNAPMSFGISLGDGGVEYGAASANALFGQRSNLVNPRFLGMLLDIMRFNRHASSILEDTASTLSLGQWLKQLKMGRAFREHYLLPMGGAIWSSPVSDMLDFPARSFVQFFANHGLLTVTDQPQWRTVTGGSQVYVEKITASWLDRLRLSCGATRITRNATGVTVEDSQGGSEHYDAVVMACHSDQTLALLADADGLEQEILRPMCYQKNRAVLHQDARLMPKRRACWSSWIYLSQGGAEEKMSLTYWMNELQSLPSEHPLFVTLNPPEGFAVRDVLDEKEFTHPVYDQPMLDAQARLPELQGRRGLWLCGAYHRYGFHEDGLASAVRVAQSLGAPVPWHRS